MDFFPLFFSIFGAFDALWIRDQRFGSLLRGESKFLFEWRDFFWGVWCDYLWRCFLESLILFIIFWIMFWCKRSYCLWILDLFFPPFLFVLWIMFWIRNWWFPLSTDALFLGIVDVIIVVQGLTNPNLRPVAWIMFWDKSYSL